MEQVLEELEIRMDVIAAMRRLAKRGGKVRELVDCVQASLTGDQDTLLPVLWYFMKAFHLPLPEVLPIREWLGTTNDEEIDGLILPAIQRTKAEWSAKEEAR